MFLHGIHVDMKNDNVTSAKIHSMTHAHLTQHQYLQLIICKTMKNYSTVCNDTLNVIRLLAFEKKNPPKHVGTAFRGSYIKNRRSLSMTNATKNTFLLVMMKV